MTKIELVELLTNNRDLYYRQLMRMPKARLLAMVEDLTDPRTPEQKRADANAKYKIDVANEKERMGRWIVATEAGDHKAAAKVFPSSPQELAAKRRIAKRYASRSAK